MCPCALESSIMRAHWSEAILLLLADQKEKNLSKYAEEDKRCSFSSVEGKQTDAVFAMWTKSVSVGNSPLSQSSLYALLIYVFASRQQSLRKGKCWKILVDCVGIRACVSVCIQQLCVQMGGLGSCEVFFCLFFPQWNQRREDHTQSLVIWQPVKSYHNVSSSSWSVGEIFWWIWQN